MGLLGDIEENIKSRYSQGAPYRAAVYGLLSGDTKPITGLLNTKSYMSPEDAANVGLGFAPMGLGVINGVGLGMKSLKLLEQENKMTLPKIPTDNVFINKMGNLETPIRIKADEAFANNNVKQQSVNIEDIIPTQRNLTIGNIKSVEGVTEAPDLIKYNGKYYISDGHHRIARDILAGKSNVTARVYEK